MTSAPETKLKDPDYLRKVLQLELGLYQCDVPPVSSDKWSIDAWITWIDNHGGWSIEHIEE